MGIRNKNQNQQWDDDQPVATDIAKTNPTPNLDSTEVSPMPKSESSIWVTKKPTSWLSQFTLITSPESTRCCHVPVPIDCRPVCEVPTVSPMVWLLELKSEILCSPFDAKKLTPNTLLNLCDDPR